MCVTKPFGQREYFSPVQVLACIIIITVSSSLNVGLFDNDPPSYYMNELVYTETQSILLGRSLGPNLFWWCCAGQMSNNGRDVCSFKCDCVPRWVGSMGTAHDPGSPAWVYSQTQVIWAGLPAIRDPWWWQHRRHTHTHMHMLLTIMHKHSSWCKLIGLCGWSDVCFLSHLSLLE